MDKIAIIDIGSARIKSTISKGGNGSFSFLKFKDETNLSAHLNSDNVIDESFVNNNVLNVLKEYVELAKNNGCKRLLTIGTHIFRTAKNSKEVSNIVKSVTGEFNILDDWMEGALFYSWMKTSLNVENICVVDIGGGSVQISFGETPDDVFSLPTGTFTLEKGFQKQKEYCSIKELLAMSEYVKSNMTLKKVTKKQVNILVMGSNCMEDFVCTSLKNIGESPNGSIRSNITIHELTTFIKLFNYVSDKSYIDLFELYPQNKYFMYGADKALINLIEICKYLSIDIIHPTNESLSSALINILTINPSMLNNFNIRYKDL